MIEERVVNVKERSRWAIKEFKELLKVMDQHRSVSVLIGRINNWFYTNISDIKRGNQAKICTLSSFALRLTQKCRSFQSF